MPEDATPAPVSNRPERDWAEDAGHENGDYQCRCAACGATFIGHKRRPICKACATPAPADWLILSLKWSKTPPLPEDLVWYRPNSCGYTTDLQQAGRFTAAEALEDERASHGDLLAVPLSAALSLGRTVTLVEACERNVEAMKSLAMAPKARLKEATAVNDAEKLRRAVEAGEYVEWVAPLLAAEVGRLRAERDAAVAALRKVEWNGAVKMGMSLAAACPCCFSTEREGHAASCPLAAAIRRAAAPGDGR